MILGYIIIYTQYTFYYHRYLLEQLQLDKWHTRLQFLRFLHPARKIIKTELDENKNISTHVIYIYLY